MTKSASTSSIHSSYTPVSQTLSGMVREMHNGLIAAIDSEQSSLVLLHTMKVSVEKEGREKEGGGNRIHSACSVLQYLSV
jgi:hypothetical protein